MTDVRIGDDNFLVAPGIGITSDNEVLNLRCVHDGVSLEQLTKAIEDNGRDEVVFRGDDNKLYMVSGGKLSQTDSWSFPKVGERVQAGGVSGTIEYANNEFNTAHAISLTTEGAMAFAPFLGVAAGLAWFGASSTPLEVLARFFQFPIATVIGTAAFVGANAATGLGAELIGGHKLNKAEQALDALSNVVD